MAKKGGPSYGKVKKEISAVREELMAIDPYDDVLQARIDAALHNLKVADTLLDCGQTQSVLDLGTGGAVKTGRKKTARRR